jgi:hypothetical protein
LELPNIKIIINPKTDGNIKIDVMLEDETICQTQASMLLLFRKGRTVITEHIQNIFQDKELTENMLCRNYQHRNQNGSIEGKISEF